MGHGEADGQSEAEAEAAATRQGAPGGRKKVIWSKARQGRFLDVLAATCNVGVAATEAGVLTGSVYQRRRRDPAFAAAWGEALAAGYEMLETQLVGHALSGGESREITNGDVAATGPINVDLALKLLSVHRDAMRGKPFRGGMRPKVATREETNAAILKKLRVMEAQQRAEDAALAATPAPLAITDGRGEGGGA